VKHKLAIARKKSQLSFKMSETVIVKFKGLFYSNEICHNLLPFKGIGHPKMKIV